MSIFDAILEKEKSIFRLTYDAKMDIIRSSSKKKVNGKTKFTNETIYQSEECSVARDSKSKDGQTDSENSIQYTEVLFTKPDLEIKQGDTIIVTLKNGKIVKYKAGEPNWTSSHQEIILLREDRA